jgi:excisionase family DNA binding protein
MRKTLDEYPEMLTVEEAAEYLRVSRAMGYQLARQYRITGGVDGLPVTQVGRCLRVPRRELARFVTRGGTRSDRYAGRRPA